MYGFCLVLVWFLQVLETCVNICGERFHNEIAKFRFLNELIKVLSPKVGGPGYAGRCRGDTLFILHWMWKFRTNLRAESVLCPQTQTLDVNPPVKGVNQLWKGFHLWLVQALLGRLGTLQELEIVLWPLSLWPFCLVMIYSTLVVEMAEDWPARSCPEPVPWFCVPCPQTSAVRAALELLKYPPSSPVLNSPCLWVLWHLHLSRLHFPSCHLGGTAAKCWFQRNVQPNQKTSSLGLRFGKAISV